MQHADGAEVDAQFVNIGVEDLIHEAYAWRLVGVLIW